MPQPGQNNGTPATTNGMTGATPSSNGAASARSNGTSSNQNAHAPSQAGAPKTGASASHPRSSGPRRPSQVPASGVDGSRSLNPQMSDDDIIAMMGDGPSRPQAFGGATSEESQGILDELGLLDDNGNELSGEGDQQDDSVVETDDENVPSGDETETAEPESLIDDDFDAQIAGDRKIAAARVLIEAGWDKDEIKALYQNSPGTLVSLANRLQQGGNQDTAATGQTFDQGLSAALEESGKSIAALLDGEGVEPQVSRAITQHTQQAVKFVAQAAAARMQQIEQQATQQIGQLRDVVRAMQVAEAKREVGPEFNGLDDPKVFNKVLAKMTDLAKANQYTSTAELMRDAAQVVVGRQTAAQKRVKEVETAKNKSLGSSDDSIDRRVATVRKLPREDFEFAVFQLGERGLNRTQIDEYLRQRGIEMAPDAPKRGRQRTRARA